MILGDNPRRLGIFFFYDAQGVVDGYVRTLLAGMEPHLSELVVVVNGELNDDGRAYFNEVAQRLLVRDNTGLDAWAYKTAMDAYGWDALTSFDELVLFNATIMGPIYPFSEMFEAMACRDLDFWGPTWFHEVEADPRMNRQAAPRHLQTHFHVYRRSLVVSRAFQHYWDHLPVMRSYHDSVTLHEIPFTQRFEQLGFVADAYVNSEKLEGFTHQPILFAPTTLLKHHRCPIIKRRSFFHDYADVLDQSVGNSTRDLYDYLCQHTDYDTTLIWDNILRTVNLADLTKNLQLTYVLPTQVAVPPTRRQRVALVMHMYYMELLTHMLQYASAMPQDSDLIITVGSQDKADTVRRATADMPQRVIVRLVENRGRDVAALLVGVRDLVLDYDVVCFIHDKKVTQVKPHSVGEGFARKCMDNVLASSEFVSHVLATFAAEPRLGLLAPTAPNHADYFPHYTFAWGPNYGRTRDLLASLGVKVPLSEHKEPIAPFGSTFWFRPDAIRPLLERSWKYEDFPPEPLAVDGTISHAVERSYCYVAQSRGYYSGALFSDRFARLELANLAFYTRQFTDATAERWKAGTLRQMLEHIRHAQVMRRKMKTYAVAAVPEVLRPALRPVYRSLRPLVRRNR